MCLTVLGQYAKGLVHYNQQPGEEIRDTLERLKWSLWHGNVYKDSTRSRTSTRWPVSSQYGAR
jgi:hypothetical protein